MRLYARYAELYRPLAGRMRRCSTAAGSTALGFPIRFVAHVPPRRFEETAMNAPVVSVLLTAYNRESSLRRLSKAVPRPDLPGFEL